MKKLLRMAFTALSLLVCSGAWGDTDVEFDVTSWDASAYTSYCGQTCNVTLKNRTFTAYEWDGAIFPFTASTEILNATFGEGKWDLQEFDSYDGNTITMKAATSIVAGTPYAIRVKVTSANPTFSGVTFASSISTDFVKVELNDNLQFWGTYFKIDAYKIVNGQGDPVTAFSFKSDGTGLGNWRVYNSFRSEDSGGGYYGTLAWFYHSTLNSETPSLSLDITSSGEGGDDPDPTTLAGKIALKQQLTNAPTIYIELPDRNGASLDDYLYKIGGKGQKADEAPYRRASIKVVATDDETSAHYIESFEEDADHLEIKVRGNSTASPGIPWWEGQTDRGGMKKPYRLKFAKKDKTTGQNFKHDLLNNGYSKRNWTLLANAFDHSLIRNAITYELGTIIGMPFNPGYKLVDLVIDGDYRGTYQVSDHCEVDANRINVNEGTGWYLEFQGRGDMLDYPMCFSSPLQANVKNPEPEDDTDEEQRNAIMNPIKEWIQTWQKGFGTNTTHPTKGWRAYNDEETLLKWWILTELTGDYDGLMTVKVYREADGKLCWGPMWDKDLAYGNCNEGNMSSPTTSLVALSDANSSSVKGYFRDKLATDPEFMTKVKATMDALVTNNLKTTICAKIDQLAEYAAETEALNEEKWRLAKCGSGLEVYHSGVEGYDNYTAYITQLKEWIGERIDFVQEEFTRLCTAANTVSATVTYDVTKSSSDNGETGYIYQQGNVDKLLNVNMAGRTFTANEWVPISLPFSVSKSMLQSIFGTGFDLKTFTGVSGDGTKMIFETPEDMSIQSGFPYLIKPTQTVANPTFNGVVFSGYTSWDSTVNADGESVTFGNYTLTANVYKKSITGYLMATDGTTENTTLTYQNYIENNGSIFYITIANGAEKPVIQFGSDNPVERGATHGIGAIYIDTQGKAAINPSTGDYVNAEIEVYKADNTKDFEEKSQEVSGTAKYYLEVRGRGMTEWNAYDKHSYRLKFAKDEKDDAGNVTVSHKHNLTGGSVNKRNWVLLANSSDESMMRNALTKTLGDQMGMAFTPGYTYYDLYINDVYQGLYMATDFVQADKEEGSTSTRIPVDESTGWVLNMTRDGSTFAEGDLTITGSTTTPYLIIKNPETSKKVTAEQITTPISAFIANMWEYPQTYVDQTSFVNWYIASEILGGARTISDFYAYKEADDETLKFGPLWGNEDGYDNTTSSQITLMGDLNTENSYNGMLFQMGETGAWKSKIAELVGEKWFADAVYTRFTAIKESTLAALKSEVNTIKSTIDEAWTANYALDTENGWQTTTTLDAEATKISTYLEARFPYLEEKFKELSDNAVIVFDAKDATTDYSDYMNAEGSVRIKNRTFSNAYYNSISLPCSVSADQVNEVFGSGTDLVAYTGKEDTKLKFTTVTNGIEAGKPYFIKPAQTVTDPLFTNVTVSMVTGGESTDIDGFGSFQANLRPVELKTDGSQVYLTTTKKLSKPSQATKNFSGTRAFFNINSGTQAKQFTFEFDGTPTAIDGIDGAPNASWPVYNLHGQRVGNVLRQGIYLKKGKKIIVK